MKTTRILGKSALVLLLAAGGVLAVRPDDRPSLAEPAGGVSPYRTGFRGMEKLSRQSLLDSGEQLRNNLLDLKGEADKQILRRLNGKLQGRGSEARIIRTQTDRLGNRHFRLLQFHRGLPVIGSDMVIHVNAANQVYAWGGSLAESLNLAVQPGLDRNQAVQAARAALKAKGTPRTEESRLVVFNQVLAYEVTVPDSGANPALWKSYVDAGTGTLLHRENLILHAAPVGGAPAAVQGSRLTGEGGAVVQINGWLDNTPRHFLWNDVTRWRVYDQDTFDWEQNPTADWGTTDRAAVSLGRNLMTTQDYTATVLGRSSFDEANAFATGYAHEGTAYVNAYWDGSAFHFGDGDNIDAGPLTTLDITAHEYGHAITQYTSDLVYSYESGALNESYSDILGALVEFWGQPDGRGAYPAGIDGQADYLMGEDCWLSGEALRDMRNPQRFGQPSYFLGTNWYAGSGDNGGVHTNSGVQNFAFYLLAEGGSGNNDGHPYAITGLGQQAAGAIAMYANMYLLTSSSQYWDAREAWILAATTLGHNAQTVRDVWTACGVLEQVNNLSISPLALNFGMVGAGSSATLDLTFSNSGANPTTVTAMGFGNAAFSTSAILPLTVSGGGSRLVPVRFQPSGLGSAVTTLTVSSNADDNPTLMVNLSGTGTEPAQVTVSPSAFSVALTTGQQATRELVIANPGGGADLAWNLNGAVQTPAAGSSPSDASTIDILAWVPYTDMTGEYPNVVAAIGAYADPHTIANSTTFNPSVLEAELSERDVFMVPEQELGSIPAGTGVAFAAVLNAFLQRGGVVIAHYPNTVSYWNFLREAGLANISTGSTYTSGTVIIQNAAHPLMTGVVAPLEMQNATMALTMADTTTVLATYNGGMVVGEKEIGRGRVIVLGLDFFAYTPNWAHVLSNAVNLASTQSTNWLSASSLSGTVPAGQSRIVTLTFDASNQLGGTYAADLNLEHNAPGSANPLIISANLQVDGVRSLTVSPDSLAFGKVWAGTPESLPITLSNTGSEATTVSSLDFTNARFSAAATLPLVIQPFQTVNINVTFTPTALGPEVGSLTIASDAEDNPVLTVGLTGTGTEPPRITLSQASFDELLDAGGTVVRPLIISNTGGARLDFALAMGQGVQAAGPSQAWTGEQRWNYAKIPVTGYPVNPPANQGGSNSPNAVVAYPFFDGFETGNFNNWTPGTGSYTRQVTNVTAASGTFSFTQIGGATGHYDGVSANFSTPQAPSVISFSVRSASTGTNSGYFVTGPFGTCPVFFFMNASGRMYVNANETFPYIANRWYDIRFEMDWTTHQLDFYVDGSLIVDNLSFRDPVNSLTTISLYNYTNSQAWWDDINVGGAPVVSWLQASPVSGTILPGASVQVDVTFNSAGLLGGTYLGELQITHNGQGTPSPLAVPARLTVAGDRRLSVSPSAIDFGNISAGGQSTRAITLSNSGNEATVISAIGSGHPEFTHSAALPLTIAPFGTATFNATFAPSDLGAETGTLTITSDAEDNPVLTVALSGNGTEPPIIAISPASFDENLAAGASVIRSLNITNTGGANLDFSLAPAQGAQAAGSTPVWKGEQRWNRQRIPMTGYPVNPNANPGGSSISPDAIVAYPFFDGFETGNFNNWTPDMGTYTRQVTNATAASGTYSFTQIGGAINHYDGVSANFSAPQTPSVISFSIRSANAAAADGYFVLGPFGSCPVFFFMSSSGRIYLNDNETIPYIANRWYDVRFEMDWTAHQLDFYLDDTLVIENLAFRDPVNAFTTLSLYNFENSQAWWDDINVGGSTVAAWLQASPTSGTILPGASALVAVTFNSAGLLGGSYLGALQISHNGQGAPSPLPVPARLTVDGDRRLSVSPSAIDFGNVWAGVQSTRVITLTNSGNEATVVSAIGSGHPEFSHSAVLPLTIAPFGTATFDARFSPVDIGAEAASLVITSDAEDNPSLSVSLSGTGTAPPIAELAPSSLSFSLAPTDAPADRTSVLSNTGGDALQWRITSIAETARPFAGNLPGTGVLPSLDYQRIYPASGYDHEYAPGRVIVAFQPGFATFANPALASSPGIRSLRELATAVKPKSGLRAHSGRRIFLVNIQDPNGVRSAIEVFRRDANVAYAEPDYVVRAIATPNDASFDLLYGMHNSGQTGGTADADIDAPEAWDRHTGNKSVLIGIIDTGIDYNHPDLVDNIWTNPGEIPGNSVDDDGNGFIDDVHGWDFANDDANPMDGHYHGTHVAGTVAGKGNNATGVAGVMWSADLVAIKFLSDGGSGTLSDAIDAVNYATAMDIRITNNSWGGGGFSQALMDAIATGGLFIAAAGNSGVNIDTSPHYPSSYALDNVVSVAATDHVDGLASFSNYGAVGVDLGAPGVDTYSCQPGTGYRYLSGTSMATPHVSGVAGLVWTYSPSLTAAEVKAALLNSVDPIASLSGKTLTGGRLNAKRALDEAGPAWITALPLAPGVLNPGESQDLTVTVNPAGLVAGRWEAAVKVTTNDPIRPELTLSVQADISGCRSLTVSPATHDFGTVFAGMEAVTTLTLRNACNAATTVSAISSNHAAFTAPVSLPLLVPPFGETTVQVRFAPPGAGSYAAGLSLTTDADTDPVKTVGLSGTGALPPRIAISPASISRTVLIDMSVPVELTIANAGGSVLNWSQTASLPSWLTLSLASGSVNPGQSQILTATLNAAGLGESVQTANLVFTHNDPLLAAISVPVTMTVTSCEGESHIRLSASRFDETMPRDMGRSRVLRIENDGTCPMHADLSIATAAASAPLKELPRVFAPVANALRSDDEAGPAVAGETLDSLSPDAGLNVLIFRDNLAWGYDANVPLLQAAGATVTTAPSSQMATRDLAPFDVIVFESQQPLAFYTAYQANLSRFEAFLSQGGNISFHAATYTSNRIPALPFPRGMSTLAATDLDASNTVVDFSHPITTGLDPILTGNSASHEAFANVPPDARVLVENESGLPTVVEYKVGSGVFVATGMTWEWGYGNGSTCGAPLPKALQYILQANAGPQWLALNPYSINVTPGGFAEVQVEFNSTGLDLGAYAAEILVRHNAVDQSSPLALPVTLQVASEAATRSRILRVGPAATTVASGTRLHLFNVTVGGEARGLMRGSRYSLYLK